MELPKCTPENGGILGSMAFVTSETPIAKDIMLDFAPSEELSSASYDSVEPPRDRACLWGPLRKVCLGLVLKFATDGELGNRRRADDVIEGARPFPYTGMLGLLWRYEGSSVEDSLSSDDSESHPMGALEREDDIQIWPMK